jgi:hypothetical protein
MQTSVKVTSVLLEQGAGTTTGQERAGIMVRTGKTRKQELEKDRSKEETSGRLDKQNKLATDKQRTQG